MKVYLTGTVAGREAYQRHRQKQAGMRSITAASPGIPPRSETDGDELFAPFFRLLDQRVGEVLRDYPSLDVAQAIKVLFAEDPDLAEQYRIVMLKLSSAPNYDVKQMFCEQYVNALSEVKNVQVRNFFQMR